MVSLQESKRRKEREEAEKKRAVATKVTQMDAPVDETGTTTPAAKKKKDPYLNEAGMVLADYILAANK